MVMPTQVHNWIGGEAVPAVSGKVLEKNNPDTGVVLCELTRSGKEDVDNAVAAARAAQPAWGATAAVARGMLLHKICVAMEERKEEIAEIVHLETGKSMADALGETGGAIQLGIFYASEGQRLFGKTCQSNMAERTTLTIRQPVGVAGLIIAANTPIANVAWKIFPALVCGNAVVLKAAEDTPATAQIVAEIAKECGLPDGVFNIVQGLGIEAGSALVQHADVGVVSFTGSDRVGRIVAEDAGKRLARVSLELGGKNPMVVCDDADLEEAVRWTILSAYSNAGQRCASASRCIVFEGIYDKFKKQLVAATEALTLGPDNDNDLGPVINQRQLDNMSAVVAGAVEEGATVLCGGKPAERPGYYMMPTLVEGASLDAEISRKELFGPILCLYKATDFREALKMANDANYGLTACIHTTNIHRAMEFAKGIESGVVSVNAATYGSEPHMPFGGRKASGNGSREPGPEAIEIYSELKNILIHTFEEKA